MSVVEAKTDEVQSYGEPWEGSDAVLIVDEIQFYVHSIVLGLASPVFKRLFGSKEASGKVVNLNGKSKDVVRDVLNIIYNGRSENLKADSNFEQMLVIGTEYEIKAVFEIVDYFLCGFKYSKELLYLADKFKLKRTLKRMMAYMVHNESPSVSIDWSETLPTLPVVNSGSGRYTASFFGFDGDKVSNDTMFEILVARLIPFAQAPVSGDNDRPNNFNISLPAEKYNALQNIVNDCCYRFPDARAFYDKRFGSYNN